MNPPNRTVRKTELNRQQGFDSQFWPVVVALCVLGGVGVGSLVTLSNGSIARVMRRNGTAYTSPIVQRLQDANGQRVDPIDVEKQAARGAPDGWYS